LYAADGSALPTRNVACKTVDHLKERGDKWKLNEELETPVVDAHSSSNQNPAE
jgi:hypothetical protein